MVGPFSTEGGPNEDFDSSLVSTDGWVIAPQWKRRVSCLAEWILLPHPTLQPKWILTPSWRRFSSHQGPLWPHSLQNLKSNFEWGSETARCEGRGGWLCFPKQRLWPAGHWLGAPECRKGPWGREPPHWAAPAFLCCVLPCALLYVNISCSTFLLSPPHHQGRLVLFRVFPPKLSPR